MAYCHHKQREPTITKSNLNLSTEPSSSSVVIKKIDACKHLSTVALSSLGPHGRNKLVYQLFLSELVDQHPAAKLLVRAAKEQHMEFGDGANLVVSIACQLLEGAQHLITTTGLHPSQIINAYNKATSKLGEILEALVEEGSETMDVRNQDQVILRIKAPVSSKLYGLEDILCPLIAEACIQVCPENPLNFNVHNVRVARAAASPRPSKTFRGMLLKVGTLVGSITIIEKAKVLVLPAGVDYTTATELGDDAKAEEAKLEELIKSSGAKVLVTGAGVGQTTLHFCNHNEIMVLEIASQFELDCFCRTTDAVALLGSTIDPSYLGYVDYILVDETLDSRVIVVNEKGGVATVLLGVGSSIVSDEQIEGAVVNLVSSYKALCRDSRIVPGAGATEIEIARRLREFAFREPGSSEDSIAIAKYADSFDLIPKTLAQNACLNVDGIIKTLYAVHAAGNVKFGIDLKNDDCKDASTLNIWDLYTTKYHALQHAADAVCSALRVDQDQEPQSMFDRLMAEHHVSGQFLWRELSATKLFSVFHESKRNNNLQPKREMEMLALTLHKDKLYRLSSDGMLSSIDIGSGDVCWSIPANIALNLDFSNKSSDCSYFVDSSRVFMFTKETKPEKFVYHNCEVFEKRVKFFFEDNITSRLVTEIYVDPVKGCCICPSRSECDEILCIRVIHAQLVGYESQTPIVIWYERVATFDIWIVCRKEGIRLQEQQEERYLNRRLAIRKKVEAGNIYLLQNDNI